MDSVSAKGLNERPEAISGLFSGAGQGAVGSTQLLLDQAEDALPLGAGIRTAVGGEDSDP